MARAATCGAGGGERQRAGGGGWARRRLVLDAAAAPRDEGEILGQRRRNPRHLLAARGAGDADAGAVQRLLGHQIGGADFLEQFLHEQAVVAAIVRDDRRQRRRIHHQCTVRRDHRREPGRKAAETAFERVAPGGIDQGDLDAGAAAVDLAQHGFEAETVAADVRLGPDLRIDRDHVALAARLHAEAREENQRDRTRLDLAVQAIEGAAHGLAGQVFTDIDTESVALELVGDFARIVDRLLQRRLGVRVFRVADHQRIAIAGSKRWSNRCGRKNHCEKQCKTGFHNQRQSSQQGAVPACAAATLLYGFRIIKPTPAGRQPLAKSSLIATIDRDKICRGVAE